MPDLTARVPVTITIPVTVPARWSAEWDGSRFTYKQIFDEPLNGSEREQTAERINLASPNMHTISYPDPSTVVLTSMEEEITTAGLVCELVARLEVMGYLTLGTSSVVSGLLTERCTQSDLDNTPNVVNNGHSSIEGMA